VSSLVSEFDFSLPPELIAQEPFYPRDHCRLMVVDRERKTWEHHLFYEVLEYLEPPDVLVINDTRVLPARFWVYKEETGGKVEILFLRHRGEDWECLLRPSRKIKVGQILRLQKDSHFSWMVKGQNNGMWLVNPLFSPREEENLFQSFGEAPTPPYVKNRNIRLEDYQTVYARIPGSVAAPTAGLHFTPRLLKKLKEKGVKVVSLTLHVGLGTFQPVKEERIEDHNMHSEYFVFTESAAQTILEAKEKGGKVVAVGTTVVRVLESIWQRSGTLKGMEGETNLFIYPGFHFQVIDWLITNFHLPRSTLFMLVCALAGTDFMKEAYEEAIKNNYRFFSFGDAMLIK